MDIEQLIYFVKAQPPLWDSRDKRYHNRYIQKQFWTKVAREIGHDVDLVKKKWHGLRDVFRKEYNKSVLAAVDFEGTNPPPSKWVHFESLLFLKDVIEQRKVLDASYSASTRYLIAADDDDPETATSDASFTVNPSVSATLQESTANNAYDPIDDWVLTDSRVSHQEASPSFGSSSRKRKCQQQCDNDDAINQVNMAHSRLSAEETSQMTQLDSDYQFLVSLYPYLKMVPFRRKLIVRQKLQEIFIDEHTSSLRRSVTTNNSHENRSQNRFTQLNQMDPLQQDAFLHTNVETLKHEDTTE